MRYLRQSYSSYCYSLSSIKKNKLKKMKWQEFVGKHNGEKMIVVGLSPESVYNALGTGHRTIGVNDVQRYIPCDYTVVIDPKECFTEERWSYIINSKSRAIFSQLVIDHPRVVPIKLNEERGSYLTSSDVIDISYTSTFVACNIAYSMGAKKIGITGQDHTDIKHSLNNKIEGILKHLSELKGSLSKKGVELVSLSANSRINEVLKFEDAAEF